MNSKQLAEIKEQNPHGIAYGGYSILFLMGDCETMCFDCVKECDKEIQDEISNPTDQQWAIELSYAYWEGPDIECAHCRKAIQSEYGDPEIDDL